MWVSRVRLYTRAIETKDPRVIEDRWPGLIRTRAFYFPNGVWQQNRDKKKREEQGRGEGEGGGG